MDINSIDIHNITESEAIMLHHRFARHFGWSGSFFTRKDAEQEWQAQTETADPMPDDMWDAITHQYEWATAMPDLMTECGYEQVWQAVTAAIKANSES